MNALKFIVAFIVGYSHSVTITLRAYKQIKHSSANTDYVTNICTRMYMYTTLWLYWRATFDFMEQQSPTNRSPRGSQIVVCLEFVSPANKLSINRKKINNKITQARMSGVE